MRKALAIAVAATAACGLAAPSAVAAPQEMSTTQAAPTAGHVSPYIVLADLLRKCDADHDQCAVHRHWMGDTFPGSASEKYWFVTQELRKGSVTLVTEYIGGVEGSGSWTSEQELTRDDFYTKLFTELKSDTPNENLVYSLIRDYWLAASGIVITVAMPSAPPTDAPAPTPTTPAGN